MFVGALVSRLIWPVLPQKLLRDNLLDLFAGIRGLLREDPHQERIKAKLSIRSVEAQQLIQRIRMPRCSANEKIWSQCFVTPIASHGCLGSDISFLIERSLPQAAEPLLRPCLESLENEFHQMLNTFSACFRLGDCQREFPTLHGAVNAMDEVVRRHPPERNLKCT